LESYIDLEKMRYNERLNLNYDIVGEAGNHRVAPLILIPFVENCFKHGASNNRSNPSIQIQIKISESMLRFVAVNSLSEEAGDEERENKGIGLVNVRRRLALIYPNQHELLVSKESKLFRVELKLNWSKRS
jgi:LytS/YehU family sensor histidine kinase